MVKELILKGKFMYPKTAARDMVRFIQAGLIDLDLLDITGFALENAALFEG